MNHQRGFTLIEVLAAVAVLAIAMMAILGAMTRHTDNAHYLRERTLATWVAQNRLTEVMSEPSWPSVGRSNGTAEMAKRDWRWHVEIKETQDDKLRRIDIRVESAEREGSLASLSAFLRDPGGSTAP